MRIEQLAVVLLAFSCTFGILVKFGPHNKQPAHVQPPPFYPAPPPQKLQPRPPQIKNSIPGYQSYDRCIEQLKQWSIEAPDLTEVGKYGQSSKGRDLYYIKLTNKFTNTTKPVVLITAAIHGNEPLSTSTTMAYIGTFLDDYGKNESITNLLDTRIIYFVPVISPDSYPHSRNVDGVDPNRNFPTKSNPNKQSVPPVQAIRNLYLQIKPAAVISGHTYGRVYLIPWGDTRQLSLHEADYQRIIGEMGRLSNYRVIRTSQLYRHPIFGTEVDWYYRQGSFAIVMEFGTHQRIPSMQEIRTEFDKTFKAVLHFIQEAPLVEINHGKNFANKMQHNTPIVPERHCRSVVLN